MSDIEVKQKRSKSLICETLTASRALTWSNYNIFIAALSVHIAHVESNIWKATVNLTPYCFNIERTIERHNKLMAYMTLYKTCIFSNSTQKPFENVRFSSSSFDSC